MPGRPASRPQLMDAFRPKLEEWVQRSGGRLRADVAHDKLAALGFTGSERTTRRAVREAKAQYRSGRVRVHRPWVTEPGMWLQYDFGDGPVIDGRKSVLFCASGAQASAPWTLTCSAPSCCRQVLDSGQETSGSSQMRV